MRFAAGRSAPPRPPFPCRGGMPARPGPPSGIQIAPDRNHSVAATFFVDERTRQPQFWLDEPQP
jgi:hypothetical protein